MFACPYVDEVDSRARRRASPPPPATGRVLVADSDTDDSLGLPPPPPHTSGSTSTAYATRAFSKRAAHCAGALLERHDVAATPARQLRCMEQLSRLGGAYRPLARGQPCTLWVRYDDFNARLIRETEAFFEGRMDERLAAPHLSRRYGTLTAPSKVAYGSTGEKPHRSRCASLGCRMPLPTSPAARTCGSVPAVDADSAFAADAVATEPAYALSRGEQCALSMLQLEEATTPSPTPRSLVLRGAATPASSPCGASLSYTTTPPLRIPLASPFWLYGDDADSQLTSPSPAAAHHSQRPTSAARPRRKRTRGEAVPPATRCHAVKPTVARALRFEADAASSCSSSQGTAPPDSVVGELPSGPPREAPAPVSLSATVIEQQNRRVQWDLMRHQSPFSLW